MLHPFTRELSTYLWVQAAKTDKPIKKRTIKKIDAEPVRKEMALSSLHFIALAAFAQIVEGDCMARSHHISSPVLKHAATCSSIESCVCAC
jgi:hypothetical protein